MGRGKSQLKEADHLVLNACRWYWWHQYHMYMNQGMAANVTHISMDKAAIRYLIVNAFRGTGQVDKWLDEDQVYYRMTKLADRGYLTRTYRGGFSVNGLVDPYIKVVIDDIDREQKDQVELDNQLVERIKVVLDTIIPGHGLNIQLASYYSSSNRVMGYPTLSLVGPGHQLRMLVTWAQDHVKAMDAAALAAEEMEN